MKKMIVALLLMALCLSIAACGPANGPFDDPNNPGEHNPSDLPAGQVRILNTDPQLQSAWTAIAQAYTAATGIEASVVSSVDAASATLLNFSDPKELPENCVDLSGSDAYAQLASWDLSLRNECGQVCAIAAEAEVMGIVYNSTLLAQTSHTRADISSFTDLTEVVYGITDQQTTYKFSAFARIDPSAHFALQLSSLTGNARNLVDLIMNNTTGDPLAMAANTESEALQDFLDGKAVFFLAGSRDHDVLDAIGTENMGVLPVYLGSENEERQSLSAAPSRYWCIPANASAEDIQATLDFLSYLVQPQKDGTVPVDALQRFAPYRRATYVSNLLESVFRSDVAIGKEPVVSRYVTKVSDGLTQALIAYATDPSNQNWEAVAAFLG